VSERRSSADLGSEAERALGAFPFAERDWESDARAVEARLAAGARGSLATADTALLAAPLPSEPGEPSSATTTSLTSSGVRTQSLAEMARRSVEQKQAAERAIARESLALAAQSRPSGEQAAVLREAVSTARSMKPSAPLASAPASAAAVPGARVPSQKARNPWPKVGLVAGAFALAAAVLLWLKQPTPAPLVSSVALPRAEQPKPESPTVLAPAPGGTVDRAAAAQPAAVAVDPSTLSQEAAQQTADIRRSKVAAAPASAAPAPSASATGPSPEKFVLDEDQPSAASAGAEKPAEKALPPDPALRPADSTGGAIPVKPSTGAVQAALGAVMSGARHCVAGDEAASSAVVVFASDGHVESVTVHGPAAGKPSGSCIEGQLSHARVQPFAAASFSVNATVRPD
jgi:hypothetical protein